MNRGAAAFLLSLLVSAFAGGAGPRAAFPLAPGQVWEVSYRTAQTGEKLTLTVGNEERRSPDRQGMRLFGASGPEVQEGRMVAHVQPHYLVASAQRPFFLCIARYGQGRVLGGFLLTGDRNRLEKLLPQRHPNDDYTDSEVYAIARKAGLDTCTLRRLR